jgi:FMN phosphatase YigB (HAD superfamily)
MSLDNTAIFFDIGDTLAFAKLASYGSLQKLEVFPLVPELLRLLRSQRNSGATGPRLGIISNTGNETAHTMNAVLSAAGLVSFFEPNLLLFSSVEGLTKKQPAFFTLASSRAGLPPAQCIFVGEDEGERKVASAAGFNVSFHLLHVFHVLETMK